MAFVEPHKRSSPSFNVLSDALQTAPLIVWLYTDSSDLGGSSFSRSSDGNSSLLDEGGSASQIPPGTVELAGYGSMVWPDSLSEWLVDGAGLQ